MTDRNYTKSFLIACLINIVFIVLFALTGHTIIEKAVSKKTSETVVALDMDKYQVQGNRPDVKRGGRGGTRAEGTGNGKGNNGTDPNVHTNRTPYAGGVENAEVGVTGAMSQGTVGDGPAQRVYGEGGGGTGDGTGGSGGGIGQDDGGGGGGYVDLSGYLSKLNSIKEYPQQAIERDIEGTVTYSVTFSAEGDVVSATLIESSGSSILDNAAYRLIMRGGRIYNTTGQPTTEIIPINYSFSN